MVKQRWETLHVSEQQDLEDYLVSMRHNLELMLNTGAWEDEFVHLGHSPVLRA